MYDLVAGIVDDLAEFDPALADWKTNDDQQEMSKEAQVSHVRSCS